MINYEVECAGKQGWWVGGMGWEVTVAGASEPWRARRGGEVAVRMRPSVLADRGFSPAPGRGGHHSGSGTPQGTMAQPQWEGRQARNKAVSRNDTAFPKNG